MEEVLRLALAYRFREELTADVLSSTTIEQSHRRYLDYVKAHPREYELLSEYWGHFFSTPRPVHTWMLAQLAARLGGDPEQYSNVYEGIFLLCHGASTLLAAAPTRVYSRRRKGSASGVRPPDRNRIAVSRHGVKSRQGERR